MRRSSEQRALEPARAVVYDYKREVEQGWYRDEVISIRIEADGG